MSLQKIMYSSPQKSLVRYLHFGVNFQILRDCYDSLRNGLSELIHIPILNQSVWIENYPIKYIRLIKTANNQLYLELYQPIRYSEVST